MIDKMVDVGGQQRRRTLSDTRPTSAANIFWSSFPTFTPTSTSNVGLSVGECRPPTSVKLADTHADVSHRRRTSRPTLMPMSVADVSVSVGKLDRQCRRPTLADTQADTQSVTLVLMSSNKTTSSETTTGDIDFTIPFRLAIL